MTVRPLTGREKFARRHDGISVADVARAGEQAIRQVIHGAGEQAARQVLDGEIHAAYEHPTRMTEIVDAGTSHEMKAVLTYAHHSAGRLVASGKKAPPLRLIENQIRDGVWTAERANKNGRSLDYDELQWFSEPMPMLLVRLANSMANQPLGKMSTAKLGEAVAKIMTGVVVRSRADSDVDFVIAKKQGRKPITPENILDAFGGYVLSALGEERGGPGCVAVVANEAKTRRELKELLEGHEDPPGSVYSVTALAFTRLDELFRANLRDVCHVKIGPKGKNGGVVNDGWPHVEMFVGRTAKGDLAGVAYEVT